MSVVAVVICDECGDINESAADDSWYECSRCGERTQERRCESCNIFVARLDGERCPDCGGEVTHAERFQAPDRSYWDTEDDWKAYNMPESKEARAKQKADSDAWQREFMAERERIKDARHARLLPLLDTLREVVPNFTSTYLEGPHGHRSFIESEGVSIHPDEVMNLAEAIYNVGRVARMPDERYFLTIGDSPEMEVSAEEFIAEERACGFLPKPECGPFATSGFSYSSDAKTVRGRISHSGSVKSKADRSANGTK